MLRQVLLTASRSEQMRSVVERAPVSRDVVTRFVAGTSVEDAVSVSRELHSRGLLVTLDHLGEDTTERSQADAVVEEYRRLLEVLDAAGLAGPAEVSVKLSAVGQALPGDGEKIALDNARRIAELAREHSTTVTLDMEDHTTTDSTLSVLRDLRVDFPETGAVVQSYLRRTESDCRDLASAGSRVRLCKGTYKEPESVAFQERGEVDRSYVRCLEVLMAGDGYPMIATHDPRLVEIASVLVTRHGREKGSYEYQMLYGCRPDEQQRLARLGERMRVYVPYGGDWYGYLMRRLAERPANLTFFLRSLATRG